MGSVQQPCNASKLHSCVEISQPAPLPTTTTTKKKKETQDANKRSLCWRRTRNPPCLWNDVPLLKRHEEIKPQRPLTVHCYFTLIPHFEHIQENIMTILRKLPWVSNEKVFNIPGKKKHVWIKSRTTKATKKLNSSLMRPILPQQGACGGCAQN